MRKLRYAAPAGLIIALIAMGVPVRTAAAQTNSQQRGSALATTPDPAPPDPGASPHPKSQVERMFVFTGSLRVRLESTRGSDFSLTTANAYTLTRTRMGLAFQPLSWLRLFGEAADDRAEFYKAAPGTGVDDPFDLRQAYIEGGTIAGNGVRARIGRQAITIGSGRLLATGDWSNDFKTYDAARATFTSGFMNLEWIAGSPVQIDTTRFDRHKAGEHFYVAYSTFKTILPGGSLEPYFMAKTQDGTDNVKSKDGHLGSADTLYAGTRIVGKLAGRFDYTGEVVRQAGHYSHDVVDAWGYSAGGGWMVNQSAWRPHISGDFTWASGDDGKKDGFHQAFDCLYGLNQPMNSLTGQVAWKNIQDWRAGVDFAPVKRLKIKIDYRDYWLATVADGLYSIAGTRTVFDAKATSNHVGEGIDTQAIFTLTRKTVIGFGFGNIRPGAYLKQAGKTTGFAYPSLSFERQL